MNKRMKTAGKRLFTPAAAVSASLLGALLLQIFAFAREGFRFHSLLALLFSVTANGFFTFLFYGAMEIPEKAAEKAAEKTVYRPYRIAGRAALGFCAVYALSGISLFGLPLAAGGGLFLILREAAEGDPFSVVIASLAAGLGCGPRVLPAMLVCGICSCIVRRFQRKYYPSVGLLSAVLTVMYSEGYDALTGTLPSLLAGAAVYMLFSRLPAMQEEKEKTESDMGLSEKEADPEENGASEVTKMPLRGFRKRCKRSPLSCGDRICPKFSPFATDCWSKAASTARICRAVFPSVPLTGRI